MKKVSVAIIGSGPAGLSAALWAKKLGLSPFVIEKKSVTGGMQNFNFLENGWVLGQQDVTGVEIAKNFQQHVEQEGIPIFLDYHLIALHQVSDGFCLSFENKSDVMCQAVIFANGTRYIGREILSGCPGFSSVSSECIIEGPYCYTDVNQFRGQHIAIVGAGDNAFENALMLLEQGCRVSMIARSRPRAQQKFVEKILQFSQFSLYEKTKVTQLTFDGETQLTITVNGKNNSVVDLAGVSRIHILAGYQPNTEDIVAIVKAGVGKDIACDNKNFLTVDSRCRTNISGLYAAGDICNTDFPCVVSAIASGALAAKAISGDVSR